MKMMYLSPCDGSAASALAAAVIAYIAGDSNFFPFTVLSLALGHARPSYLALMAVALLSAGGMLSASVPSMTEHIPPPAGLLPKIVVNPKRTCESSCVMTVSIALLSLDQEVSTVLEQTSSLEVRQWYMLPDRSTTRYTVGIIGSYRI
jgi:hypothetical protein